MARQVIWSPRAIADLEAIAAYIAADSPSYAAAVVRKVFDSTRLLGKFPASGRKVPEFDEDSVREVFAFSYRVIYRVAETEIIVAAVVHGQRSLE